MLPGYLMGDQMSRTTTFTPSKKSLSFASTPTTIQYQPHPLSPSLSDHSGHQQQQHVGQFGNTSFNRSALASPISSSGHQSKLFRYHSTAQDVAISAPPTVGLFDSLRDERNNVTRVGNTNLQQTSYQQPQHQQQNQSFVNSSGFNYSRVMSPIQNTSGDLSTRQPKAPYTSFWVTVFGFPQSGVNTVLNHFAQCGVIIEKVFPPQNGNWIHLRFSSRMECDKALNYNGKIIANSLMVGVLPCNDLSIISEEVQENSEPLRIRSLAKATFETSHAVTDVEPNVFAPKQNNGIVSKAMDLFFGW